MISTIGISPKVATPTLIGFAIGVGLLIVGLATTDNDLRTAGLSVVLAAAGYGGVGYAAPPGNVRIERPVASDSLLSDKAKEQL